MIHLFKELFRTLLYAAGMLGMIFRFISGVVMGVPIAVISYYLLPVIVIDFDVRLVAYIGLSAGLVGALWPTLLMKTIALSLIWKRV